MEIKTPEYTSTSDDIIYGIFPIPVSITKRDTNLSPEEEKEIGKIIKEEMQRNFGNSASNDTYIFDSKLKKLKQYCEQQLKIYVERVIYPVEELDFYITQSWLNETKPGESHHDHYHRNSIVSGVFYVSTVEDDKITFIDPNQKIQELIKFETKEYNSFNTIDWFFPVNNIELVLFPSWLNHRVDPNPKATTDRISLSFNTFIRGSLGNRKNLTELNLKFKTR